MKWIGLSLAGLIGLLAVGIGVFFLVVDWNWFKGFAGSRASGSAGREVAIDGDLDVKFHGRIAEVRARDIRIANAEWGEAPNLLELGELYFRIDLLELLRGRTVLPELTLTRPKIALEKPDEKRRNWDLGATPGKVAVEATVPDKRTEVPVIGQLVITDGELGVKDVPAKLQVRSTITTVVGKGDDDERSIEVQAKGTVEKEPFTLKVVGGSILSLREASKPYPLNVELRAGQTSFAARGTMTDPVQLAGIDLVLDVKGDSLSKIFPFTGIPLPPTRPYALSGHLLKEGDIWRFQGFKGRIGGSDIAGDLRYDGGQAKPDVQIEAVSKKLDFADLSGLIGAGPAEKERPDKANANRVIPEVPINLERLRAANLDIHLRAASILAPNLPLQDMDARFNLRDGLLKVQPLKFGVADGVVDGLVHFDGRKNVPGVGIDLNLRRLSLKRFFDDTRFAALSQGRFGGRVTLDGQGKSLAEVLAVSNGRATLSMSGGQVSALMLDAASVDIAKAVAGLLGTDKPTALRCFVADFQAQKGVLTSQTFILDTERSLVEGQAKVRFADEGLDIRIVGHPKQPSPMVATTPITIGGHMKSPAIGIDPTGAVIRGAAAAVLGVLFPPAAIIPFIELGLGEDSDCSGLIHQAQTHNQGAKPEPRTAAPKR